MRNEVGQEAGYLQELAWDLGGRGLFIFYFGSHLALDQLFSFYANENKESTTNKFHLFIRRAEPSCAISIGAPTNKKICEILSVNYRRGKFGPHRLFTKETSLRKYISAAIIPVLPVIHVILVLPVVSCFRSFWRSGRIIYSNQSRSFYLIRKKEI